jgi:hypothetical protein
MHQLVHHHRSYHVHILGMNESTTCSTTSSINKLSYSNWLVPTYMELIWIWYVLLPVSNQITPSSWNMLITNWTKLREQRSQQPRSALTSQVWSHITHPYFYSYCYLLAPYLFGHLSVFHKHTLPYLEKEHMTSRSEFVHRCEDHTSYSEGTPHLLIQDQVSLG